MLVADADVLQDRPQPLEGAGYYGGWMIKGEGKRSYGNYLKERSVGVG